MLSPATSVIEPRLFQIASRLCRLISTISKTLHVMPKLRYARSQLADYDGQSDWDKLFPMHWVAM